MNINLLVKITSRAWSLDILRLLSQGVPGRQAALLAATGAARGALSQSLTHLVEIGLVERNPGHGHPLRPEFRLSSEGARAAEMAQEIGALFDAPEQSSLLRRNWTLPILAVSHRPIYFSGIKSALTPITDRALSQTLKQLEAARWVQREARMDLRPPRAVYQAHAMGAQISGHVQSVLDGH